jgi:hypothetical protein
MTDIQQVEAGLGKKRSRARRQPDEAHDVINFDAVVTELKQIVARGSADAWRVAELAYKVETRYRDETLTKLAKQLGGGIAACTLQRRRTVYQAWADSGVAAGISFAVAQELAPHPDRVQIIRDKPNISSREARKKAQEWKEQQDPADPSLGVKNMKKWFDDLLLHASRAVRDANIITHLNKEDRRNLKKAIPNPRELDELREAIRTWTRLAEFLQQLVGDAAA